MSKSATPKTCGFSCSECAARNCFHKDTKYAKIVRSAGIETRTVICKVGGIDEPFGALDPANRVHLQNLVKTIHRDSRGERTVVFVTHDVDEALSLGTRIAVLGSSPGRLLALEENPVAQSASRDERFRDPRTGILREGPTISWQSGRVRSSGRSDPGRG